MLWYYAKDAALPQRCNCDLTGSKMAPMRPHALMLALSDWLGVHMLQPGRRRILVGCVAEVPHLRQDRLDRRPA